MRYLMIHRPADATASEAGMPPTPEMMQKMGALIQRKLADGKLLSTEGCLPSSKGALVNLNNGKLSVTDGPFAEAKEIVGGFAIFRVNSMQEAIAEAHEFLEIVGGGDVKILALYDQPACDGGSL
ncbi:MAG: hypothetical protein JST61_07285 [Acidobacteria bacterium]|nr:hypothetical protein [Acidobacteriota bacterium]